MTWLAFCCAVVAKRGLHAPDAVPVINCVVARCLFVSLQGHHDHPVQTHLRKVKRSLGPGVPRNILL